MRFCIGSTLALLASLASLSAQAESRQVGQIWIDESVPKDAAKRLEKDLERLSYLPLQKQDPELQSLLKISTLDHLALIKWLEARVDFLVGPRINLGHPNLRPAPLDPGQPPFQYQNPGILPRLETPTVHPTGVLVLTAMNLGTGLYIEGKTAGRLLELDLGTRIVRSTSPRIGVIQIHAGLFDPSRAMTSDQGAQGAQGAMSNTLNRLSILFHEARHSDGNKESLGFLHAVCPEGHKFAGMSVCDRNANGPYQVEGTILRSFTESCERCSSGERERLRLKYLNSFERVISKEIWDDQPEGLAAAVSP